LKGGKDSGVKERDSPPGKFETDLDNDLFDDEEEKSQQTAADTK
jgi:hypothetical protein